MMSNALWFIAVRFGDLLGISRYARYSGFTDCAIAITAVYALIPDTLLLLPKHLAPRADRRHCSAVCRGQRPCGGGLDHSPDLRVVPSQGLRFDVSYLCQQFI